MPTYSKIIVGDRNGRVICLNWLGEVVRNEGFDLHAIAVQSEFGSNAGNVSSLNFTIFSVMDHIHSSVNCQDLHWAPTLGGFLVTLTDRRLLLVILPLSRLVPEVCLSPLFIFYSSLVHQSGLVDLCGRLFRHLRQQPVSRLCSWDL